MSATQAEPRLAESLVLHGDKGRGLLLRLYHLKRELRNPNSDFFFLQDKSFQAMARHVAAATAKPGTSLLSVAATNSKEISRMGSKIRDEVLHPLISHQG